MPAAHPQTWGSRNTAPSGGRVSARSVARKRTAFVLPLTALTLAVVGWRTWRPPAPLRG
jgi:hypothetical protein